MQQSVARDNGVIATPDYPLDVQNTEVSVFQDRFQEKRTLLLVSVIHFICVLPNAVYTLCYEIDNYQITYGNVVCEFYLDVAVYPSVTRNALYLHLHEQITSKIKSSHYGNTGKDSRCDV